MNISVTIKARYLLFRPKVLSEGFHLVSAFKAIYFYVQTIFLNSHKGIVGWLELGILF
jgi:hypothetical protein